MRVSGHASSCQTAPLFHTISIIAQYSHCNSIAPAATAQLEGIIHVKPPLRHLQKPHIRQCWRQIDHMSGSHLPKPTNIPWCPLVGAAVLQGRGST
jgi:hypothetical protein